MARGWLSSRPARGPWPKRLPSDRGFVGWRLMLETTPLALAALLALLLGQRLQARIEVSTYQSILRKLLLLLAIILIYQFLDEMKLLPGSG